MLGAAPVTTTGLVAEREMIGPMLQEILHTVPGAPGPAWTRVDDLTFNRTEGRWDYMSMDSRAATGLISAWSLDHNPAERVFVSFLPFALAGNGPNVTGQMMRMEDVIIATDSDHEVRINTLPLLTASAPNGCPSATPAPVGTPLHDNPTLFPQPRPYGYRRLIFGPACCRSGAECGSATRRQQPS